MRKLFCDPTLIGILPGFSPKKVKIYRLANTYTLCAIAVMAFQAIVQGVLGLPGVAIAATIAVFGLSFSLFFTARQQILKAEIMAMVFNNLSVILGVVLYGERYWNHLYFILLIVPYLVIFGPKYLKLRNAMILLTLLLFGLSSVSGSGLLDHSEVHPNAPFIISRLNLFCLGTLLLYFFYAAVTQNRRSEMILSRIATKAERERAAKSEFLSVMSHEIRTPLNAILGVGHLLSQPASEEEQNENIKILNTSANLLLALVNDILDFNKLEAGKIAINETEVNIQDLLEQTFQMFANQAHDKGLAYQFSFDDAIQPDVIADASRIHQVISNLLSNAIKFSHDGKVQFSADLVKSDDMVQTIHFEVCDDGIGIDPSKHELVFEGFTQAGADTTVTYGGSGLGLSICRSVVNLMGSEIQLSSSLGKGSCFGFSLDLRHSRKGFTSLPSAKPEAKSLSHIRILLAEDNLVNQVIMRKFFEQWHARFAVAVNGAEAIEMLDDESFDVVLMDIQMPVMDGFETARIIRNTQKPYRNIPIVALTADITNQVKDDVIKAGMNDLIIKPFDPDRLLDILQEAVKENLAQSKENASLSI